ncbi:hypothetical protein AB4K20DRAFT_1907914 [Rhizopus microsporus]
MYSERMTSKRSGQYEIRLEDTSPVWLPPISSLLLPSSSYSHHHTVCTRNQTYMPIIPYFFHHKQFGIEACMLQLLEARQTKH